MGCHTWYYQLVTNNQEEIVKIVKDIISNSKFYNWYEFTNLNDLFDSEEEWLEEISEYVYNSLKDDLFKVNGVWGIYKSANGFDIDEPRIGGYPEDIITSSEQMFNAMRNGLKGWQGGHFEFRYDSKDEAYIKNNIIKFFEKHPSGIITFG